MRGFTGLQLAPPAAYAAFTLGVVLSVIVLRLISNKLPSKAPPVFEGLPFIGGIIKFAQGPMRLMDEGYKRYGEVFTVPVAHKKMTFLIGPHVSEHFFKASDDELSQKEVYEFSIPTFGKGVVYDIDHKIRAEHFRFFGEALKTSKLKEYVPHFVKETEEYFAKWPQEGVVDLSHEFAELIILTASRTLLGREVRENMFEEIARLYHDLDQGMQPISVIFPHLPIAVHRTRDRARKQVAEIFKKVIETRRATGTKEDDVLQVFIDAKYKNAYGGRHLNDEEITGMLIAGLFAGQHTSSITSAWTGLTMVANQEKVLQPTLEEQRRILKQHGDHIDVDVLNEMDVLHSNMTEVLRLFPPLILLMRLVKKSFTVTDSKGRQTVIPKGHILLTSPGYSHRLGSVFQEPLKYDPDRFRVPFSFIGFGGGRHGCMGSNFAYLQIKTIWSVLLRNFEFEMLDPFPEPDYEAMVVGPKPCRTRFRRRQLQV
eukprot:jgi/Astpho2/8191/e_gw1.00120.216.1_t